MALSEDFDNIQGGTGWWPKRRNILRCDQAGLLLIRYFILNTRVFGIFLHHLISSDDDRALHDHPWSFITILLTGGYWEHTTTERLWRGRFSVLFRPAEWQHRLELEKPVWTLVIKFRTRRSWGFIMKDGWHKWEKYLTEWCND